MPKEVFMLLHRLTLWPGGRVQAERIDLDALDADAVTLFKPLFAKGLVFDSAVPCDLGDLRVKWTGSESGQALLTCAVGGDIFHIAAEGSLISPLLTLCPRIPD
jgi:hypothetical protein